MSLNSPGSSFYAYGHFQRSAMDSVLADIAVADPTAHVNKVEEMADVASRTVKKKEKQQDDKKEGKGGQESKKKEKKRKYPDTEDEGTKTNRKKENKKKRKSQISSEV